MTHRIARRLTLVTLSLATIIAVALPVGARAATGSGETFAPSVYLDSLHVLRKETGVQTWVHWRSTDGRVRQTQTIDLDPRDEHVVIDQERSFLLGTGFPKRVTGVTVTRNMATVAPDGYDSLNFDVMDVVWPSLARVRGGSAKFTFGGAGLLKMTHPLGSNECAGLRSGTRTLFVETGTLVPRRVIDRRAGKVERDTRYARRGGRVADFAPLKVIGKRRVVADEGFVRRSPAAAAKVLDVQISVPRLLPTGFKVANTGSATKGGMLGPEGSFPRSKGVFFAKWRRGLESLDFTIRPATGTLASDWDDSDPFGGECETTLSTSTEQVGTNVAHYAVGEERSPRLWWRAGRTLYTLSGPFSAAQLVAVANSLENVG